MARGVNGGGLVGGLADIPIVSSTFSRTASREIPQGLQRPGADPVTLADEPQENVLGADEAVVEQARFLLRPHQDLPCPVREPFEHLKMVPVRSLGLSANFSLGSLHRSSAL